MRGWGPIELLGGRRTSWWLRGWLAKVGRVVLRRNVRRLFRMVAQRRLELSRINRCKRWVLLGRLGWWLRELWLRSWLVLLRLWYSRRGKLLLTRVLLVLWFLGLTWCREVRVSMGDRSDLILRKLVWQLNWWWQVLLGGWLWRSIWRRERRVWWWNVNRRRKLLLGLLRSIQRGERRMWWRNVNREGKLLLGLLRSRCCGLHRIHMRVLSFLMLIYIR